MISLVCRKCMDDFSRSSGPIDILTPRCCRSTDPVGLKGYCKGLSATWTYCSGVLSVSGIHGSKSRHVLMKSKGPVSQPEDQSDSMMTNILVISNLYSNYIQIIYVHQIQKFSFFQFCQSWVCLFLLKTRADQALEKYRNYLFYMIPRYSNFLHSLYEI